MPRGFIPTPNEGQRAVMKALGFQLTDEVEDADDCIWYGHGLQIDLNANEAVTALYITTKLVVAAREQGREFVRREIRDALRISHP